MTSIHLAGPGEVYWRFNLHYLIYRKENKYYLVHHLNIFQPIELKVDLPKFNFKIVQVSPVMNLILVISENQKYFFKFNFISSILEYIDTGEYFEWEGERNYLLQFSDLIIEYHITAGRQYFIFNYYNGEYIHELGMFNVDSQQFDIKNMYFIYSQEEKIIYLIHNCDHRSEHWNCIYPIRITHPDFPLVIPDPIKIREYAGFDLSRRFTINQQADLIMIDDTLYQLQDGKIGEVYFPDTGYHQFLGFTADQQRMITVKQDFDGLTEFRLVDLNTKDVINSLDTQFGFSEITPARRDHNFTSYSYQEYIQRNYQDYQLFTDKSIVFNVHKDKDQWQFYYLHFEKRICQPFIILTSTQMDQQQIISFDSGLVLVVNQIYLILREFKLEYFQYVFNRELKDILLQFIWQTKLPSEIYQLMFNYCFS